MDWVELVWRVGVAGDHTFGVCDLTFPARASEPWTLPMIAVYLLMDANSKTMLEFVITGDRPEWWGCA